MKTIKMHINYGMRLTQKIGEDSVLHNINDMLLISSILYR